MEHTVHTVIMLFLAVYAGSGTCEVSPDFRLGSGAGATHSDSTFHDRLNPKYSRPRSSAEPMPIVAFALLWAILTFAILMILWTYLVSWQDTASDFESGSSMLCLACISMHLIWDFFRPETYPKSLYLSL